MSIKLLHFADVHLGMENYGMLDVETGMNSRVLDFLDAMDYMISIAEEECIDLTVFAGDAFKSRQPNPTLMYQFAKRIQRLANIAPVVMIVGNHDYVGHGRVSPLMLMAEVEAAYSIWVMDSVGCVDVGYAYVVTLPWLDKSHNIDSVLYDVERVLDAIGDDDVPRILAAHCSVEGAVYGSERQVMLGRDTMYPRELFCNDMWDYVALGHIHKHQVLDDHPPVIYPGSLERIDFGESGDVKGFVIADVMVNGSSWEFVDVDARPMVVVDVEHGLQSIGNVDVEEAIVKVVVHSESGVTCEEAANAVRAAGAHSVATVQLVPKSVARETRLSGENIEEFDVYDLLEMYWEERGYTDNKIDELLDYAEEIVDNEL